MSDDEHSPTRSVEGEESTSDPDRADRDRTADRIHNGSGGEGVNAVVDREFLLEAVRRANLLTELRSESKTASDLTDAVTDSRSTVHRAIRSLEERNLIETASGEYELTNLGRIVADEAHRFRTRVGTAGALEPFLNAIDVTDVPTEHFAEADVTRPKPHQPHRSIQRIIDLIEEADSLRMLSTVLSPIYVDVGYREMMDGMEIEAVFDERAIRIMLSEYQEKARETVEAGNFDLYVHEGLPFELFLFDDRMGMAAHDEQGIASLVVECEERPAIEWAEEFYDRYRSEAEHLALSE